MSEQTENNRSKPEWLTFPGASRYSGLSTALLYELAKEDCIICSTVLRPGRRRGRRLIQRASLDAFIEQGIGKKSIDNIRGGSNTPGPEISEDKKGGAA